jgi:hypothetical protein
MEHSPTSGEHNKRQIQRQKEDEQVPGMGTGRSRRVGISWN